MMNDTALLASLPENTEENICLLFEAGAQQEEGFLAFKKKHYNSLYSLYIHPQLTEFQNYGPWLLEMGDKKQLKGFLSTLPGCVAVILTERYPPSLAVQLSRGCTVVSPEGTAVLTRFYAGHVIETLAACAEHGWHASLFRGITQWWLPGETQWQPLNISASEVNHSEDHIIRPDNATWQKLADKPEVTGVSNEWQKMPDSRMFPSCTQRLMVVKALKKAADAGLKEQSDRMLYALCYLNGRKKMLESEQLRALLPLVSSGKYSFRELLVNYFSE